MSCAFSFPYFLCRNLVERRLAYGKALQYQSRQMKEKVIELDLNFSNSGGETEKKEALEKHKKDFKMPKPIEGGKRSKSALRSNKRKSKRKRNSSVVTRSQSVQRQTSQAGGEESREPELPIYPFLPRDLTLTRLRRGDQ